MYFDEFRAELINETTALAAAETGFVDQAFVAVAGDRLIRAEELSNVTTCHAKLDGPKGKRLKIGGFDWDEDDDSLKVVVGLYHGDRVAKNLTKSIAETEFKAASAFVDAALGGWVEKQADLAIDYCRFAQDIRLAADRRDISRIRFYLVSDGVLSDRVRDWPEGEIRGIKTEFRIWDCKRIFEAETSRRGQEPIVVDFTALSGGGVSIVKADSHGDGYQGYLGVMSGEVLAEIYERYGARLLEGNVRAFLSSRGKVNKGIRDTILKRPRMFFAFNNGISVTATAIKTVGESSGTLKLTSATDFQIVNGGQTTASLATTRRKDNASLAEIVVAIKLSVVDEAVAETITPDISRFANSQNKVSDADLWSNHPIHVRIEKLSKSTIAPATGTRQYSTYWFYERARGQYVADLGRCKTPSEKRLFETTRPKAQIVTKELFARAENAWNGLPHFVSMGGQKNFLRFAEITAAAWLSNEHQFHEEYFKRVVGKILLLRAAEAIAIEDEMPGIKAHIANYSVARCAVLLMKNSVAPDWDALWKLQSVSDEWREQLRAIVRAVAPVMITTDSTTMILTEWFKKDVLWQRVKSRTDSLTLSKAVQVKQLREFHAAEAEAKETQIVKGGIDGVSAVLEYGPEGWMRLWKWELSNKFLSPAIRSLVEKFAGNAAWTPTSAQASTLLTALRSARLRGFDG